MAVLKLNPILFADSAVAGRTLDGRCHPTRALVDARETSSTNIQNDLFR